MIHFKYANELHRRNRSNLIASRLDNASRKTYDISKHSIRLNTSADVKRNQNCYNAIRTRKNLVNNNLKPSKIRILHKTLCKNPLKEIEKQCEIRNNTEKFYDNEGISISSLLTVPRISSSSHPLQRSNPSSFMRSPDDLIQLRRRSRKSSVGCTAVKFSIFSEEYETPTPVFQPRYVNQNM